MSLVKDHMHTLKTVPISLRRQTYFETINFNRFVFLFYLHYTNLLMTMTKAQNILSKVNNMNSIEQFLAHSLIMDGIERQLKTH